MRIVFIGAVQFSRHCLEVLLSAGAQIDAIFTPVPELAHVNSDFVDLKPIAESHKIPLHLFRKINDPETIQSIRTLKPDVIFALGFSQLISKDILQIPPKGCIGCHPALLPHNRGRHPLIWSLFLDLNKGGLTFFIMDETADSGPILSQEEILIDEQDTAESLYKKVETSARHQLRDLFPRLQSGTLKAVPQVAVQSNSWRKRTRQDGHIDWRMGKRSIQNLVRALYKPYPGAEATHRGKTVTIWKTTEFKGPVANNVEPGKVIGVLDHRPIVKCYDGAMVLEEFEPPLEFLTGEYIE